MHEGVLDFRVGEEHDERLPAEPGRRERVPGDHRAERVTRLEESEHHPEEAEQGHHSEDILYLFLPAGDGVDEANEVRRRRPHVAAEHGEQPEPRTEDRGPEGGPDDIGLLPPGGGGLEPHPQFQADAGTRPRPGRVFRDDEPGVAAAHGPGVESQHELRQGVCDEG